jgi:hypothetical protein
MAMVLWRAGDGHALHVAILDGAGEVVARVDLGGLPELFHWQPDGSLQLVGLDTEPSVVWTRDEGPLRRPWLPEGPPPDQEGSTRLWRDATGMLWDCGPGGVRTWPDTGPAGEIVPAGPWWELDGLLVDPSRGRLLAWSFAGEAAAWDLVTGERLFLLRERDECLLTLLGDGRIVLVGRAGVRVFGVDGGGYPLRLSVPDMQVDLAAAGPGTGTVLLLGARPRDEGALVRWIQVDGGEVLGEVAGPVGANAARAGGFLDGGETLWVAWQRDGGSELVLHDARSGAMVARHDLGMRVVDSRMFLPHPDGAGVVLPGEGGPAVLERGAPPFPLLPDLEVAFGMPVGFSPSGTQLAWFGPEGLEVRALGSGTRRVPAEPLEDLSAPVALVDEDRLARARGRRVEFLELLAAG